MLSKTTCVFAKHEGRLECDVYEGEDYTTDAPVLLFFHSGGLSIGDRSCIPPWLVQTCFQRKWPLISASYRFLPQAKACDFLEDATAAYEFARNLGDNNESATKRRVIVSGASAGFFMATLTAHHLQPPPLALLSITGITTFRHPFFNSHTLLTPKPIDLSEVEPFFSDSGPPLVSFISPGDPTIFSLEKLLSSGVKNPHYKPPPIQPSNSMRGCLYDYFLYNNSFVDILGEIDPGYEWAKTDTGKEKLQKWPPTVIIQGNADFDVDMKVSTHMVDCLGEIKVKLCLAEGQEHLFEATKFLEDETGGMDAVRIAISHLDKILGSSK